MTQKLQFRVINIIRHQIVRLQDFVGTVEKIQLHLAKPGKFHLILGLDSWITEGIQTCVETSSCH